MNNTSYDVIVVGGGNAALCSALSAREQGAKVLVLERASREERGGNSTFSGGGIRIVHNGLKDLKEIVPDLTEEQIACTDFGQYTAEQYFDDLGRTTEYRIDPDLAEILVKRSTETVLWMRQNGVRFFPHYEWNAFEHDGRFEFPTGFVIAIAGGGRALMDAEFKSAEEHGIAVRYDTRAISLLQSGADINGVRVISDRVEEDIRARAVVLACGGFESNREWRARCLGPGWDLAKVRGTCYNTGDGIRMALEIGAQPAGHWSGAHASEWDLNAPEYGDQAVGVSHSRQSYPFGIVLNANGFRFLDEGADLFTYTYAKYGQMILEQPGQFAWQIFDSKVLHRLRNPYRNKRATKVSSETLEELVAKLHGVNTEQALKTIKEYNACVKQAVPFNPAEKDGRGTAGLTIPKSNWAQTIDEPPYEAYAVTCGITFTYGGVKVTPNTQVVDVAERPIPGLYAAGEMVGGIFYFNYPAGSGLVSGAVFGRVAGKSAAHYAVRQ